MPTSPRVWESIEPFESKTGSTEETSHKTILMLRAKIVVVGDACVGKTAVVQMLKSGGHDYPKNYIMVSFEEETTMLRERWDVLALCCEYQR